MPFRITIIVLLIPFFDLTGAPAFAITNSLSNKFLNLNQLITETCELKKVRFDFTVDRNNEPIITNLQNIFDRFDQIYDKNNDKISETEIDQRLQISTCAREFLESFLKEMKNSGMSLSLPNLNKIFHITNQIIEINDINLQKYITEAKELNNNKRSMALLKITQKKLSLKQFIDLLRSTTPEENAAIFYAEQFLYEDINPNDLQETLEFYASTLANSSLNKEQMEMAIHALIGLIFRNAFSFSPIGIQLRINTLTNDLKKTNNDERAKSILQRLIIQYSSLLDSLSYNKFELSLRKVFKDYNLPEDVLNNKMKDVSNELEDHIIIDGLTIHEGDILLNYDTDGFGTFFYSLAGLSSLSSHTQLVFADHWGPVKFYYTAQALSHFTYGALNSLQGQIVMRMDGNDLHGKTAQIFSQAMSRPFYFDVLFHDGLFDKTGKFYNLYCAEFVHYSFKNGLNPNNSDKSSPFDFVQFQIDTSNQVVTNNLNKLGYTDSHFFVPDQLFFNPQTTLIGIGTLQDGDSNYLHPRRIQFYNELRSHFYHLIGTYFTHLPIRPISFFEQVTLKLKFAALNYFMDNFDIRNLDFPHGTGAFYFMKFLILNSSFSQFIEELNVDEATLTKDQRQKIMKKYEQTIVPAINDFFELSPTNPIKK